MSVLLLVRHGQASFGKRNYDALSDVGHEQARILGAELAARGVELTRIVTGAMQRHAETGQGIVEGLGAELPTTVDDGWNEFDFHHVMSVHKPLYKASVVLNRRGFQSMFEDAAARWTGGEADDDYAESFPAFVARVRGGLERVATEAEGAVLVVSSGGPIGLVASELLAGDASLWPQLNRVAVNAAVTKVLVGNSGMTLSSYNEHGYLPSGLVTYR